MIVKISVVLAIATYINGVSSASFSKVFVQNGHEYPVEYVQYGSPSTSYNPQVARLTAAPVGSVVPYASNYVPCGSPCVYPGQVASVAPSAKIVQYQPQNLPVVVAPSSVPSGYEFSYVVYDEQTGDHKIQRERSDGSAVQGGYSFLQPDGYVREVQYVADDTQGFNAVVKNYLPAETKKHVHVEESEAKPCKEVKHDHLKPHVEPTQPAEASHANLVVHVDHVENAEQEPEAEHVEAIKEHQETSENIEPTKEPTQEPHEAITESNGAVIEHHEAHVEHLHTNAEPNKEHHKEHFDIRIKVEEIEEETTQDKPQEAQHEVHDKHHTEILEHVPVHHEVHETVENDAGETVIHISPVVHETHVAHAEQGLENSNVLVPYNDIIRCVQSALNGVHETSSPHKPESPLTYIILNKPC